KITETPSKGLTNNISSSQNESTETKETKSTCPLLITEIFPDPLGADYDEEFIELYNSGSKEIELNNFRLENKSGKFFNLPTHTLKANEYFAIKRKNSLLILNNLSDTVKLFQDQTEKAVQSVTYKNSQSAWSYNLNIATSSSNTKIWSWENTPTPGKQNQIKRINQAPTIEFYFPEKSKPGEPIFFDSSDTEDSDNEKLSYFWEFGDNTSNSLDSPEHTFLSPGKYIVSLTVSDGENEVKKQKSITVSDEYSGEIIQNQEGEYFNFSNDIIINELLPAPSKNDKDGEWIEIYNRGDVKINLLNWKIKDNSNDFGFVFSKDFWLANNSYHVLKSSESKISLNNDFDLIQLFDSENNLIDEIEYEEALSENSFARGLNDRWLWTASPTPEKENIISLSDIDYYQTLGESGTEVSINNRSLISPTSNFKIGERATVQGFVTVLPGKIGSQFFYIASSSSGMQIYSNKKDFPELTIGDLIEVSGELSQINDEWRLKTISRENIKVIGHTDELPKSELACGEVNEDYLSQLIEVSGEIVSKKGSTIFLDDGTGELALNIKTSTEINLKNFKEGDFVSATGILSGTRSGPRLLPREASDIIIKTPLDQGQVLGTSTDAENWELENNDQNKKLFSYTIVSLIGIIIILLVLLLKKKN
ncbi:MAG: lamin tail domain-containing protein, partial [Candidatus Magasanikbacteria bacterium]|nr:lamin tail domain-containing protein [Candidatus Magasanikbacteria bacterium]